MTTNFVRSMILLLLLNQIGCSSAYYGAMEKIGYHKRDLMVSRVRAAKDSQQEAKEQFRSALDRFHAVIGSKGGKLQEKYDQLSKELERSEKKAEVVRIRIDSVEDVSGALFSEWKGELGSYKNDSLRKQSETKLVRTKDRYNELITAMKRAESRIDPVLQPLRDNVLFLKHNLNAQAIGSLGEELRTIETNVDGLIADLETSIAEADQFVGEISEQG